MSRILLAWELGAGAGHLAPLRPVVERLLARGHQVTLAAQNLRTAARVFADLDFPIIPAPCITETYGGLNDPPLNFAEILMRYGYIDAPMLATLLRAWSALIELSDADILLADHAPTALLASRNLPRVRSVVFGNPFSVPPAVHPAPNMRPWLDVPPQRLINSDALVLETINRVVPGPAAPLAAIHQLFDRAYRLFVGTPELDPYGPRADACYLGLYAGVSATAAASWPPGDGRRIFAYLRADYPHIDVVLAALAACGARCLIHLYGASETMLARHRSPRLIFSESPVDIASAAAQCDFAVCHSGLGTVNAILRAGKPMLLLPAQLEQFLLARNVARLGAALVTVPENVATEFDRALHDIHENPAFSDSASAYAQRYREPPASAMLENIVARIEGCAVEAMA